LVAIPLQKPVEAFTRVVQTDMAHPFMIMMTGVLLGTFVEMSCMVAVLHVVLVTGLLTFAHIKGDPKLIKIGKVLNVVMTGLDFLCIFATDVKIKN
jgi:hypothetical protein